MRKRATNILNFCPPHLKTVTTLLCEIRESYFSSLQLCQKCQNDY